jgi:hypothetical protein
MTQLNGRWVKVKNVDVANTFELTGSRRRQHQHDGLRRVHRRRHGHATARGRVAVPRGRPLRRSRSRSRPTCSRSRTRATTPQELKRLGATNWTLTPISFVPGIATPAAPGVVGTARARRATRTKRRRWLDGTLEESLPSPATTVANDLTVAGNKNVDVTPAAVAGAVRYNVYKLLNGLYGYIGQTDGSAMRDNNITPDVSKTPAIANTPFTGAEQQARRCRLLQGPRGPSPARTTSRRTTGSRARARSRTSTTRSPRATTTRSRSALLRVR